MRCCDLKTWVLNFATHTSRFWNTINFILKFELQQLRVWYVYIIIVNFATYNSRFWDIGTFILIVETYHLRGCDVVIIVSKLCNWTRAILRKCYFRFDIWNLPPSSLRFWNNMFDMCSLNVTFWDVDTYIYNFET